MLMFSSKIQISVWPAADGYYALTNIPFGKYGAVPIIGYTMITKDVSIKEGESIRGNFRMTSEAIEGQRVDVFGEAQKMSSWLN